MKQLFYLSFLFLFMIGCQDVTDTPPVSTTDPAGSSLKSQQAYESLEIVFTQWADGNFQNASDFDALNFKTANALYKEAIQLNPDNMDAHVGAAITEILCTYADTAVNRVVKQWESFGNGDSQVFPHPIKNAGLLSSTSQMVVPVNEMAKNLLKIYTVAKVDPPLISDMQRIIRDAFLPRINYAIEQLAFIENVDTFKFRVSGKMQGDSKLAAVYLYPTEFMMTDALLQGVKSMLEGFLVYKFELSDYKQASLVAALQQNSTTFFYLASDGTTHSQNAKAAMNNMIDKMLSGITKLENISGRKSDAVIKIGNDGLQQTDLDTAKKYLNKMKTSMTSAITVHLDNVGSDETPMDIQVFLGKFFDNPVQNPKASFLPSYSVTASGTEDIKFDFTAQTFADFHFPDPTFGGLFPGMTDDNMKKLMRIDEEFGFRIYFNTWWDYSASQPQPQPYTVKIVTDAKTYSKQTDYWGVTKFIITDQNNVSYKVLVNNGTSDYELTARPGAQLMIKARSEMDHSFKLANPPQNLTAYSEFSQIRLEWNNYDFYWIMKGTGATSTPTDYQQVNYQNTFWDNSVTNGITYRYQLRTSNNPEDYNMGYGSNWEPLVLKEIQYSNIVTITKQ
ncbi:MAG: hypothetical protein COW85_15290 [Ignavibacteria bacterium CG22_combo_CG10-13_8_21_14_all_37_15]|nr:MAG: hypothetical protein COW85_15290 [Ignavibacteria bacterium CG22_combo_CG10-13_8_21_14_all_37_15]